MSLIVFLLFWPICALIVGAIATSKNRSFVGYFLLSLVLSPLIGLIALLVSGSPTPQVVVNNAPVKSSEVEKIESLEHLAKLKESGVLSDAEFQKEKARLLA